MIQNALQVNGCKAVILYYGYRTKSTEDIDSIISSLNNDDQHVVALFFDYLKRIRSARDDAMVKNSEKLELGAIINEFKAIAATHQIPVVTGHQLNRQAAAAIDALVAKGGFDKTSTVLGASTTANSWDIQETADFVAILNIENDGSQRMLMIKAVKQRDKKTDATDSSRMVSAIRHPFISSNSFALQTDINENCSVSIPIYIGKQNASFLANI
jgi:replicative DNA helicase